MSIVQEKIAQAKAAGYTDDEIAGHLAATPEYGDKIKTATAAGYKASEIVGHLSDAARAGPLKVANAAPNSPNSLPGRVAAGAGLGVADIGNTVLNAASPLTNLIPGGAQWNRTRNADMDALTRANEDSTGFQAGRIGANIAMTAPVGGAIAGTARAAAPALAAGRAAPLVNAIASAGMRTGSPVTTTFAGKAADLGARSIGGAITGGASAALVNPDQAGMGAAIGGALPGALKAVGGAAQFVGGKALNAWRGAAVSPEVAQLATRAKELRIEVPADRIANSKPLNALAASLNYIPGSGRAGTETTMQSQLNRALSKTFGQDTDNVTAGLRKARDQLGGEFDRTLQANTVRVDAPFLDALRQAGTRAASELETGQAQVIKNQIDEIMLKANANGEIDGQAAYNIKKTLDRIGRRITPEAFYANDLKRDLMEALNRSMTSADAAAFATTRKQYSNMLSLDKLAQNGVDGNVSIARIANMKNIGNKDLQELADISAQFLKPREGQHGAMQRIGFGAAGASLGGLPALAGGMAAGRVTNAALNSNALKALVMGQPFGGQNRLLDMITNPRFEQQMYRSVPVVSSD